MKKVKMLELTLTHAYSATMGAVLVVLKMCRHPRHQPYIAVVMASPRYQLHLAAKMPIMGMTMVPKITMTPVTKASLEPAMSLLDAKDGQQLVQMDPRSSRLQITLQRNEAVS